MTTQTEALKLALEAAYLAGFNASGEGYNGEYPFGDKMQDPAENPVWKKDRDNYIKEALAQPVSSHGNAEEALKRIAAYPFSRAEELSVEQMREIAREALAQPELCKYGQEPKSCTSSPMDCQCAIDATLAQPEQEPDDLTIAYMAGLSRGKDLAPQRKPLPWERVLEIGIECANDRSRLPYEVKIARAIEAAHGIKD